MRRLFILLALAGCATTPPIPERSEATCADVCARGAILGCAWSLPTPKGATCEAVCDNATAARIPWRLDCMASANTCEAAQCP